jgi:hypothetical protein
MIDQAKLAEKIKARFGPVSIIRPGVFRTSEKYGSRDFTVRYFDITSNIGNVASNLREYQEELLGDTFFGKGIPADLRWNHYLYFISSEDDANAPEFRDIKARVEADRTYARKAVLTEKELDSLFRVGEVIPESQPRDIASQWTSELDVLGLSFILDDTVSAPEAARLIKRGTKRPPARPAALQPLTKAETVAGGQFLRSLSIGKYRNYPLSRHYEFGKVNLISGRNGTGKTSLLEAIEYLYCKENRRHNRNLLDIKVTGTFFNSDASLLSR